MGVWFWISLILLIAFLGTVGYGIYMLEEMFRW